MKTRSLVAILAATAALSAWLLARPSATPASQTAREANIRSEAADSAELAASIGRMEREQKRIAERLGMSAPMEVELINGVDPVMEALENGFIIEATLEEVEAALAKAAATPEIEDDIEALRLKHRGSYRYFVPDAPAPSSR